MQKERSQIKKMETKKKAAIITGPRERIEVPDTVEWDHNRQTEEKQIKDLTDKANKELTTPISDIEK